ncbi:MAG: cysteine desulfurase [Anaerolineales bacterium]|jgi:cysteine desulfurase/selenocysteine lyase
MTLDVLSLRKDFPILEREIHPGIPLVYLDSAATTQKPRAVLAAMEEFYRNNNANINRGVHTLAEESTAMYEQAREKVAKFINSPSPEQVIFTRNATEAINLVAYTWARTNLNKDDLVILTEMEHHSNLVPWHMLMAERGVKLEFVPVTSEGLLDLEAYQTLLARNPKLVAFSGMSNVLGTINPITEMARLAHAAGAIVLVDGAQAVPHLPVDVQSLGVDFLAFSAHKMLGPTGVGGLYGRRNLLEAMPPFLGGGDMIKTVHLRSFIPNGLPQKFEAGTPAIAEAVGFGTAVDYLARLGMDAVAAHEREMVAYALERLEEIPGVKVLGPSAEKKGGVAAFTLVGVHPHDIAQILDRYGIAVRAGHHCAQPLHEKFGITATARASFYIYSLKDEVDKLVDGIYQVKKIFD